MEIASQSESSDINLSQQALPAHNSGGTPNVGPIFDILSSFPANRYGPLFPKGLFHADRIEQMLNDPIRVTPLTVQLALTLECSHMCWFCTYGSVKPEPIPMATGLMAKTIEQLHRAGVKAVTFTGGGEPTMNPNLVEAMALCRQKQLDFSLFSNGNWLAPGLAEQILRQEPVFMRISLNAGTPETEIYATLTDDFDRILMNLKSAAEAKLRLGVKTDINVGFVVNVLNVDDLPLLAHTLRRLIKDNGLKGALSTLQIRPTINYPSSKYLDERTEMSLVRFLEKRERDTHGEYPYVEEFLRYYRGNQQLSPWVVEHAWDLINRDVIPALADTGMHLVCPEEKFKHVHSAEPRNYARCVATPWVLFIWPDGKVYGCIEWAGSKGMEIGDLSKEGLPDILSGERRAKFHAHIDQHELHSRCPPSCAQHEPNLVLNKILDLKEQLGKEQVLRALHAASEQMTVPSHINFV